MNTATATYPCARCLGSGRYSWNPRDGSVCYGCNGTGVTARPPRARRPYTPPAKPTTISIETICGGDPTKYHLLSNPDAALRTCGITRDQLAHYADLYRNGVRVVLNPFI